jgi:hypothetical protein
MSVKTYDPAQVQVIFAGIPITGFADGSFVKVYRHNPMWSTKVGADGEGARAKSNDKSGAVEVTLMQSSSSNDLLSAQAKLDELSGDGVGPAMVKDASGTTLHSAESAWIEKPADSEFGKETGDRTWIIQTDNLDMFVGGNNTSS